MANDQEPYLDYIIRYEDIDSGEQMVMRYERCHGLDFNIERAKELIAEGHRNVRVIERTIFEKEAWAPSES